MNSYATDERQAIQTETISCAFDPHRYKAAGTVRLGNEQHAWSVWDGQQLGRYVAIDTETTPICGNEIPLLCMVSISDGKQHYLAKPDQLAELLQLHAGGHLVFHNAGFDFWVMDKHLAGSRETTARNLLWDAVDKHRCHDTMLLAALVTLAQSDDERTPSLADAVQRWCGYELPKDSYRLRFAETTSQSWQDIDPGFLRYAVCDAIATWQLFTKLTHEAHRICLQHQLPRQFGWLTEAIQVKAAICLARIQQNGLYVDMERAETLRQTVENEIQSAIEMMQEIDADLWHRYKKTGLLKTTAATGLPKLNQNTLLQHFERIATEHSLTIPRTATGKLTTSTNHCWVQYRHLDPAVDAYCQYTEQTKLRTFFDGLKQPRIHPRYRTMVRSGRTSCSGPNIQQLPNSSPVREAIAARPGHLFFIIDYNSLELRTLATVCHQLFGFSKLREVLIDGADPHSYAAAMFAGVSLNEFNELPDRKQLRQRAKVFNFGLPAGFGAAALVDHAKFAYGVELSLTEAEHFVQLLTQQVYPELGLYLTEDTAAILANALHADLVQLRTTWPQPYHIGMLRKVLEGNPSKADGTPYQPETVNRLWDQLTGLCSNPDLLPHIHQRNTAAGSPLRKLLHAPVATTTGRLRGGVRFTAAKNCPFQGLAADGCKQAMWDLTKAGYRLVAFIHDEFIIELNQQADIDAATVDIPRICSAAMQPFVPGIPVPCGFALAERWHKNAEAVWDTNGKLQVWHPV